MPVYNGEKYLCEAIDSILGQSFRDYEFLIIDDGSKDTSVSIIKSFNDHRIRFIRNEKNLNLPNTLNRGIELAQGKYIARMDQDDISLPSRLAQQVEFMELHPEVGICGGWIEVFGLGNYVEKYPADKDEVKASLLYYNPIAHPTVMMRKSMMDQFDLRYSLEFLHAEDYELWQRGSQYFQIANIPAVLLKYRTSMSSYCRKYQAEQNATIRRIDECVLQHIGIEVTEETLAAKKLFRLLSFESDAGALERLYQYTMRLKNKNKELCCYPEPAFTKVLEKNWFVACNSAAKFGLQTWYLYYKLGARKQYCPSLKESSRFFLKCLKYQLYNIMAVGTVRQ
jgi:glycosyltransferase involved in cell wall biosynthesis